MEGTGITVQSGDSIDTTPKGGKTISCTKGSYWIDQAHLLLVVTTVPVSSNMSILMEQLSQIVKS